MCFLQNHVKEQPKGEEVHLPVLSADDAWLCLGRRFKIRHGIIQLTQCESSSSTQTSNVN